MGKKNKRKKKKRKIVQKPDDYFSFGAIEGARFGNVNILKSNFTNEQFAEMQSKLVKEFPIVCNEIDELIENIVKEVNKYAPLDILKRAYWEMANYNLKIKSEVDINQEGVLVLRMVDYLQSIMASTEPNSGNIEEITNDGWRVLRELVRDLFNKLNIDYQICRTAVNRFENPDLDMEFEEYHYKAQTCWCNIRGRRYVNHEQAYFEELLLPHSEIIKELFEIDGNQLIEEILKIQYSLTQGLTDATRELHEFRRVTLDAIEPKLSKIEEFTKDTMPKLMAEVLEENNWNDWQKDIFGKFFGLSLFDIEQVTNLPRNLIEKLTWKEGQDAEFFAEGDYMGWPLRIWPIFKRPFIKLEDHYYCFDLYSLLDNFYRVMQRIICTLKPEYKEEWNSKQKTISEQLPFKYLSILLPDAKQFQSVYYKWYPNENSKKQWCEVDGLLIYDDHLFIIEVKAGAFTYTSPANDFPAYIESLKNLVLKPSKQGKRFLEYLKSDEDIVIYDNNYNEINTLSKNDFEHIQICAVTLDSFTELASQVHHLKNIGIDVGDHPVWSLSIDDLRVYSDVFDNPLVFLHFVEQRMKAFRSDLIKTDDELDHLGLYLKHNIYTLYVESFNSDKPVSWIGYRSDIDEYFYNKLLDPSIECPLRQKLTPRLKEIIDFMAKVNKLGYRKVASTLLDLDDEWRNKISSGIDELLTTQKETGRPKALFTDGETKLTIFCWNEGIVNQNKKLAFQQTQAAMLINNDNERVLVELFYNRSNTLIDIDYQFFSIESIDKNEIENLKLIAKNMTNRRIEKAIRASRKNKIGRNELCPCGSGKKYKFCHGKVK